MLEAFSTALGTALTGFVSSVEGAITDNFGAVLGLVLGIIGIFLVWRIVARLINR